MVFADVLFVLFVAVILTAVFGAGLRRTGPWTGWWWFFLIVLLGAGLAAVWARPIGPPLFGVTGWIPIIFLGFILALLLAAATPGTPPQRRDERVQPADRVEAEREAAAATATVAVVGVFFWILLAVIPAAIIIGALM